jgi:23S rRNA (guanosine2251-2'-O)-methyltransferase
MANDKDLVFGINPVLEKLREQADDVREILVSEAADRAALRLIKSEAVRLGLRWVSVAPRILDQLAGTQKHQGVIAKIEPFNYLSWSDWLRMTAKSSDPADCLLILDGLTDPRNFGAILRTAEAVGIRSVIIPKDRSVEVTPVVVKTSAGASHHLKIVKVTNIRDALIQIKRVGYWIVGLDAESRETLYDRKYPSRLAIVLGSEGKGIRPLILRECDFKVSIPMSGKIASLNVAVAAAIFMYEVVRQNRATDVDKGTANS